MRKLFWWLVLVIILVSLNWFTEARASQIDGITDSQMSELIARAKEKENDKVKTSPIFDSETKPGLPSLPQEPSESPNTTTADQQLGGQKKLTPFEKLKPFGQELFGAPSGEAVPPNDIASSSDYILGPGDNLIIYLWGRVEKEYNLTVDREGKIIVPQVGEMTIWGLTLEEFKSHAKKRLSKAYTDFDLTVSLGKIRSIRIYLTGEVSRPGAYTVSSLTSMFNALYLAGGPSGNGTMRNIKLMRNGTEVAVVDIYRFLLQGDNSMDVKLESGDAVFVPVVGDRVAVRGHIRRPAIYELQANERVSDLLQLAGNTTADAYLDRVMLERVSGKNEWEVIDLNLTTNETDNVDDIALMDGDRMSIFSIFDARKNMVAVTGHVEHPGVFERNDSTRISTLVERAQLQPYDVYFDRANLFRRHSDWRTEIIPVDLKKCLEGDLLHDLLLQDRDSLHIYSLQDMHWDKKVSIGGEVKTPGEYELYENMTAQDLVFLAGSYTRAASLLQAEIAHVDSVGNVSLDYIDLSERSLSETILNEGDRLYIRQIPEWRLHRTVTLQGEVAFPGEYVLASRDEGLYQMLSRAGGFTSNAFPRGLIFERETISNNLERLRIPEQMENSEQLLMDSVGRVYQESVVEYEPQLVTRVILDVDKILASGGRDGDLILEPGDKIYIPSTPSGITVMGSVGSNGTIKFLDDKKVKYYVERAGNFGPQADKKGTRLLKANGEVFSGRGTLGKRVDVGDVIIVPSKIKKDRNLVKTLGNVLSATTGVLTTILLIDKL